MELNPDDYGAQFDSKNLNTEFDDENNDETEYYRNHNERHHRRYYRKHYAYMNELFTMRFILIIFALFILFSVILAVLSSKN